jgi:CMD domain protein
MTSTAQELVEETNEQAFDLINHLAGITPDSPLAQLRAQRPEVLKHAQGSYESLLEPEEELGVSRLEREAIALRVAALTKSDALAAWHRERLAGLGASAEQIAAIENHPNGGELEPRLDLLLAHVTRVSIDPLNSSRSDIDALRNAGLSARDVVTVSQLFTFLSYQVRALATLRVLAEETR